MGMLDWLDDLRSGGGSPFGGAMGEAGDTSAMRMPPPASPPMTAGGAPSNGNGLPYPPGGDPMAAGGPSPNGPGLPPPPPQNMPVPTPRPTGAGAPTPPLPPGGGPLS